MEVGLSSIICLLLLEQEVFKHPWETVSLVFAFLSIIGLLVAPLLYFRLTRVYLRDLEKVKDPKLSKHFKLFEGVRTKKPALQYQIVFFLRRYLMLLILTLMYHKPISQVFLQMLSTMYVVTYLA